MKWLTALIVATAAMCWCAAASAAGWTSLPVPSHSPGDYSNAVACASSNACFVLDEPLASHTRLSFAFLGYDGTRVRALPPPPGNVTSNDISGLACPSARLCIAVGDADNQPSAMRYDGRRWTSQHVPGRSHFAAFRLRGPGAVVGRVPVDDDVRRGGRHRSRVHEPADRAL